MTETGPRGSYFFLSYAHSQPLAGSPQLSHDRWVRRFFGDLTAAVRRLATRRMDIAPGFFDQEIPVSSDWHAWFTQALGTAQAFVPLYSPGYFAGSWPGREWDCFARRLAAAKVPDPQSRFVPVLWIPLRRGELQPGLDKALSLGADEPGYAENGLRAMLRLSPYRDGYLRIVERAARSIARLAEQDPVTPSPAPDIGLARSPFGPDASAVFVVASAAPSGAAIRPFRERQELSLPDYAATVAEQLDFSVLVADLESASERLDSTPAVILIDPRFAADQRRLSALHDTVHKRPWVLAVIVIAAPQSADEEELTAQVRAALLSAAPSGSDPARQALAGVGSLERFVALLPYLIAEAERQFLRHGPVTRVTAPPGSRPRLRGAWTN